MLILENENYKNSKNDQEYSCVEENNTINKIMNILKLGLSLSVDKRVVWQTCNLFSAIFQNIRRPHVKSGFKISIMRWALNEDHNGDSILSKQDSFIICCLMALS